MQRKTDRFQRIVAQAGKRIDGISPALADPMFTVKLLRRQHRAYVRQINNMVKVSQAIADNYMPSLQTREFHQMRVKAAEDILHQVKQYKR